MAAVVFACKSNSCRSQMAEGWAHKWIQDQVCILKTSLQEFQKEDQKGDLEDDELTRRIEEHIDLLQNTAVISVALDSSAVFETSSSKGDSSSSAQSLPSSGHDCFQRKPVKSKAVEAMAKDGVDISLYKPKTINEVLPSLLSDDRERNNVRSVQVPININNQILEDAVLETENVDSVPKKSFDKLIVLCSCGEELKYELTKRSKSVEEWSIDAPTAASKAGEGDQAYHRVSTEIRKEVNILDRKSVV